ncbi:MAG: glycosyl transferase family protein [Thiotrichales bacterium]|nr:glycosyl transferase family protein [Thiotrichales bacterium]
MNRLDDDPTLAFSAFLRILGRGPKTRRSLTSQEAALALKQLLAGQVTDRQLGAFLLLMRANGESTAELQGFLGELRRHYVLPNEFGSAVDLDWPAYAGKWRYPPYYLLAIKLLAQQGYRVLLHGDSGQFQNRVYANDLLAPLDFTLAESPAAAQNLLARNQLTYLPLANYAPELRAILHLKEELGVRTVFNTLVKLLNPLGARASLQGIYHKGVENLHYAGAQRIQTPANLVFKGEGGEAEMRPDALSKLYLSQANGELLEVVVPAKIPRQPRPDTWQHQDLLALWQGQKIDLYGEQAVMSTAAVGLMVIEVSRTNALLTASDLPALYERSYQVARQFWDKRSA